MSASQIASQAMLELNQANELAQKLGQDMKQQVSNVSNVRLSPPKTQQSPPQQARNFIFQTSNGASATQPIQPAQAGSATQSTQQQFQTQAPQGGAAQHHVAQPSQAGQQQPPQGSDEWHRQRRENHKEVERRRRETINEGINELQKIVPGCEKNKGSILARSVQYIQQLKDNEAANIEKWTLEKLLTDQAISELSQQVDMLKAENDRLRGENERLRSGQGVSTPSAPESDTVPVGKRKRTDVEAGAAKNG